MASFSWNETDLTVKKILVDIMVKFTRFLSHKICGTHVLRAAGSALCLWEIKLDPESSTVGRKATRRAGEEWAAPAVLTAPSASVLGALRVDCFLDSPPPSLLLSLVASCWCQAADKVVGVSGGRRMENRFRWSTCDLALALGVRGGGFRVIPGLLTCVRPACASWDPAYGEGRGRACARAVWKQFCDASSVVLCEQEKPNLSLVPCARSCHLQPEEQGLTHFWRACFLPPLFFLLFA